MTVGEKISALRVLAGLSQEELAESISVSRQSVSKWELDKALPSTEKLPELCQILGISLDRLLNTQEDVSIKTNKKTKYFGTDGFRGEVNINLTSMHAYKIGRFLGWYYSFHGVNQGRPKIVIGKDTRRSSYTLEYALVAGITASGADAYMLHVTTTPSVSFVTRQDGFDCGIMITASHNPFYDNGIKVINRYGEKLDDRTTSLIEAYIDGDLGSLGVIGSDLPLAQRDKIGCIVDYVAGRNRYVGYLISLASHSYKKLRIGLDCANGASWMIARNVFSALGAQVYVIGDDPDGLNINLDCGSTHIEALKSLVKENHLDMGFAFDGDADRCIAVDENGNTVDGDAIMYILGKRLKSTGVLKDNTIVATVMSNSGLISSLKKIGIDVIQTAVGDRFVYECMLNGDYGLGGEQSGHIIIKKYATTGDGILSAIMLTEEVCSSKSSLSSLCENIVLYPQQTKSIRVNSQEAVMIDFNVQDEIKDIEEEINGRGRVLLRKSGTEPVIRIMVECEDEKKCESYIDRIASKISQGGHCLG